MLSGKDKEDPEDPEASTHGSIPALRPETDDPNEDLGTGHVQCTVCSSTFRRPEHLKRHLRSHTKEKPFECAHDTLHRHEMSHHTTGSEGKDRTHRITVKTFRACFGCATARVRCSGGIPCGRCDTRSLECQYPTQRRSKAKALRDSDIKGADAGNPNPAHRASNASSHINQFPIHRPSDPTSSSKPLLGVFSTNTDQFQPTQSNVHRANGEASNTHAYQPRTKQEPSTARPPLSVYNEGVNSTYNHSNPGVPKLSVGSSNLDSEVGGLQPTMSDLAVDIEMTMEDAPSLGFDPSLFGQSMHSTINWLPTELIPGALLDQTQPVSSHHSQSFGPGPYFSHIAWQPPAVLSGQTSSSHHQASSERLSAHIPASNMESPGRYSHGISETSPQTISSESAKGSVDNYAEVVGPRQKKSRTKFLPWSDSPASTITLGKQILLEDPERRFGFPVFSGRHADQIPSDVERHFPSIESSTYDELHRQFTSLCRSENPFCETFETERFPTADELTRFIALFFDSFQAVYPILHLPTFNPNSCHWLLTTSIAALGCHVAHIPEMEQYTSALHEFLRRGIFVEVSEQSHCEVRSTHIQQKKKDHRAQTSLEILQAMLFNCIGLVHSGAERDIYSASGTFGELITLVKTIRLLAPRKVYLDGASQDEDWNCWVQDEVKRRTGYCIWLLDCTLAYYFDNKPLLSLDDGQASLPAHEKLWQAASAGSWKKLWEKLSANESLYNAVHILYVEKRLIPGIGEFSHILIIHALYHRTWEVGDYFRRPLSFWNPTAKKQSRETAIPTGSVWLPGIPSYSKWRNSACDCLDILHWTANSTVAKAAGLEHPTVLHLHAARLILLAPFREMRSLATALATEKLPWSKRHQSLEWQYVRRWIEHDQYKARLSIIHAGVTLWHIRRYSTNAFHEPVAIFIAVLTLWAYGACHAHASHESTPLSHSQTPRVEPGHDSRLIHLDRPCDDELVQLFVREGHSMRASLSGVGDLCGAEGPERLLRVGCGILSEMNAWGTSSKFAAILSRLADLTSHHSWNHSSV
ncbi:unnamed protein product [Penicillium salamii]|uniref:Uncharacterized protein n=1 Tax=Penicillium salamii TaxID=1612424 RepID=A0A9W4IGV7_9EURO|nr:unnamed protein product [Penicillium salamii]CAG8252349.1 unnamed protein product [Penicillium salamii]CAG8276094.1 unnamed protein product [Penicillium salamii]CAG8294686.1 unnamed protein product [Penicillium salamii]CAG8389257.1 unnamed protein product [Penicillium salamii]